MGKSYDDFLKRYNLKDERDEASIHIKFGNRNYFEADIFTETNTELLTSQLNSVRAESPFTCYNCSNESLLCIFKILEINCTIKDIFISNLECETTKFVITCIDTYLVNNKCIKGLALYDVSISDDEICTMNGILRRGNIKYLDLYKLRTNAKNLLSLIQTIAQIDILVSFTICLHDPLMINELSEELFNFIADSKRLEFLQLTITSDMSTDCITRLFSSIGSNKLINRLCIFNYSTDSACLELLSTILIANKNIIKFFYYQKHVMLNLSNFLTQMNLYSLIELKFICNMNQSQVDLLEDKLRNGTTLLSLNLHCQNANINSLLNSLNGNNILKSLTISDSSPEKLTFDFLSDCHLEYLKIDIFKYSNFFNTGQSIKSHFEEKTIFNIMNQLAKNVTIKFLLFGIQTVFLNNENVYDLLIDKILNNNITILKLHDRSFNAAIRNKIKALARRNKSLLNDNRFRKTKVACAQN